MTAHPSGMPKAVIIGVGPSQGLGAALGRCFASAGHHVVLAGRSQDKLDALVGEVADSGGAASAVVTDATDEVQVQALFDAVDALPGELHVAIYNAGNNRPGRVVDMDATYFEQAWRIGCWGGFLFGREALRRWSSTEGSTSARSLLFTGASASLRGRAGFGAFSAAKAGLRHLAQAMAKEAGPDGIHVGHVVVDGGIAGDKIIKGVPQFAEHVGEDGLVSLEGLAQSYLFLHHQPRTAWTFELDVRTFKEAW